VKWTTALGTAKSEDPRAPLVAIDDERSDQSGGSDLTSLHTEQQ
jgi:hypothetical protein